MVLKKKVSINKFYYTNFPILFQLNYTVNTIQMCSQTLYTLSPLKNYKIGISISIRLKYFYA